MDPLAYFKEKFNALQSADGEPAGLTSVRKNAFSALHTFGIPTSRNEEWKYTRIGNLLNKEYRLVTQDSADDVTDEALMEIRLPGADAANELYFINGYFSKEKSTVRSESLTVLSLEEAVTGPYSVIVQEQLGHSGRYLKDGINALNTSFVQGGVFLHVAKGVSIEHPVYIYNITDTREGNTLVQPRSLLYVGENAVLRIVETYATAGLGESLTNQVMEVVMEQGARVEYYKIQNDVARASAVSTSHFRMIGKSYLHAVTISLNGGTVRNNLDVLLEAERCEAHLYGLYFQGGNSHVDNHTTVDNIKPNCFSNELYKGVMADQSTGVFNGKIFVRPQAQKTNAYQSNKNILLSETATVNSKPQLEIYADDVKCSHGCTVGLLDQEALFYLQSRGIPERISRSLLVRAFATDILEHIKLLPVRNFVEELISKRLEFDIV